jgi:hypothetical protein
MAYPIDPAYLTARKALLDVLDVLGPHSKSIVLVGAQAIYIHTGETEFAISPFTYDADLAINPIELADNPKLIEVMKKARFGLTDQPRLYNRTIDGAQVDLLVPAALGGAGRRGARLGLQGNNAAMKVRGLEGALVDHSPVRINSLDENDRRTHIIELAGPAALLVSKVLKVFERVQGVQRRQDDKDAFDIFRLLRAVQTPDLTKGLNHLLVEELSSAVATEAIEAFNKLFGDTASVGVQMVVRHIRGIESEDIISSSCVALSQDLIRSLNTLK